MVDAPFAVANHSTCCMCWPHPSRCPGRAIAMHMLLQLDSSCQQAARPSHAVRMLGAGVGLCAVHQHQHPGRAWRGRESLRLAPPPGLPELNKVGKGCQHQGCEHWSTSR